MTSQPYHIPALLKESIEALDIRPEGVYVDATFGGGGHSRAIMAELGPEGRLYGFDRDLDAYSNRIDDPRFTFVHSNFRYIPNFMRFYGERKADGIMADLGVSFHHFDDPARGFTFRADAPLDMRMTRSGGMTAADVVNTFDEKKLASIFSLYGELRQARRIASLICAARGNRPIDTTSLLLDAVKPAVSPRQEKKELAQIFQALRIEVNGELDALRSLLESSLTVLRPGGRLAVLTYHSIEDRMVKNFMRSGNPEGTVEKDFFGRVSTPWETVTRTPVTADADEVERNPRSRSAKLRVAVLKDSDN